MSDTRIRLLREEDWDEVVALEERAYAASGLSEGEEALRSRHRASPSTCFVLEHAGGFAGYLLALPYPLFRCPDLSLAEGGTVRENRKGSNLHLHDLVIAERARGRGLARRMQRHLEETGWSARYRTLSWSPCTARRGCGRCWATAPGRRSGCPRATVPRRSTWRSRWSGLSPVRLPAVRRRSRTRRVRRGQPGAPGCLSGRPGIERAAGRPRTGRPARSRREARTGCCAADPRLPVGAHPRSVLGLPGPGPLNSVHSSVSTASGRPR